MAKGSSTAATADEHERALLKLVAGGSQAAYKELYLLLSRRVYAFARQMAENAELADEIMVDTMYEVWRTASRFRGDSKVSTWILGIARFKVLMAMRSGRRHDHHEDIEDFSEVFDDGVPDMSVQLEMKERHALIHRCLERLSADHRECIHLIHFEDLTMPEVAEVLMIPEGTVKSRLSIARKKLAACVETKQRSLATS